MVIIAGLLLIGCVLLALSILGRRQRWERPQEIDDAIQGLRDWLRRPSAVLAAAAIVALALIVALARNPGRWALLLLALAALAAGTAVLVAIARRRSRDG